MFRVTQIIVSSTNSNPKMVTHKNTSSRQSIPTSVGSEQSLEAGGWHAGTASKDVLPTQPTLEMQLLVSNFVSDHRGNVTNAIWGRKHVVYSSQIFRWSLTDRSDQWPSRQYSSISYRRAQICAQSILISILLLWLWCWLAKGVPYHHSISIGDSFSA